MALLAIVAALGIIAARHVPTVRPNTYVGPVPVGGLSLDEAARQIRVWWEGEKRKPLQIHAQGISKPIPPQTPGALGVTVDDQGAVANLPTEDLASDVSDAVSRATPDRQDFEMHFKTNGADLTGFAKEIKALLGPPTPAKVVFTKGQIFLKHEIPSSQLNVEALPQAVADAWKAQGPVELPLIQAPKHVPDDALSSIKEVVSTFTTHFRTSLRTRCWNIRLASSKLKGVILMPGDKLSFNGTVGRRTLKAGFKVAGIYKNGKHDVGIGGGICQVSTTLYNSCLFADLKIRQRSNHSLPVPYVPLGRDATVDYGALDLVIENSYSTPIAIDSTYEPGRLTFRILGKKDPALSVKVIQQGMESWNPGVSTVTDMSLKPGAKRIVEPGSWGHAVTTYRLVYESGKLVRRERLGRSTYGGKARIVAVNPTPVAKPIVPSATVPLPATPAVVRG
ncbi:MAG TPA: VanW family protein [Fimbriimonas sp.]|nr:VanW family protein [Fimbriimonas sp.]